VTQRGDFSKLNKFYMTDDASDAEELAKDGNKTTKSALDSMVVFTWKPDGLNLKTTTFNSTEELWTKVRGQRLPATRWLIIIALSLCSL
jgi:hypothetical protein